MSLYPGAPRLDQGQHVLDDSALERSMAKAIEEAMDDAFQKVKGSPIPEVGKQDRRLLYVAISRGVLQYLSDHQETMRAFEIDPSTRTGDVDLNVTMDRHLTHISLQLSPEEVAPGASSDGRIELSDPAPPGGANVSLSSDNVSVAAPDPPSVKVPQGERTATFKVKAVQRTTPIDVTVTITASFAGGVTQTVKLRVFRS